VEEPQGRAYGSGDSGAEQPVVAGKSREKDGAKGLRQGAEFNEPTSDGRSPMNAAKPFCISKKEVWEAYKRVKENKGAAGSMISRSKILRRD
jgi:RNA-directed DNA polymerase